MAETTTFTVGQTVVIKELKETAIVKAVTERVEDGETHRYYNVELSDGTRATYHQDKLRSLADTRGKTYGATPPPASTDAQPVSVKATVKLTAKQQEVYDLAARPQGLHTREGAFTVGRNNGRMQALNALIRKGLVHEDGQVFRVIAAHEPAQTEREVSDITPADRAAVEAMGEVAENVFGEDDICDCGHHDARPIEGLCQNCYTSGKETVHQILMDKPAASDEIARSDAMKAADGYEAWKNEPRYNTSSPEHLEAVLEIERLNAEISALKSENAAHEYINAETAHYAPYFEKQIADEFERLNAALATALSERDSAVRALKDRTKLTKTTLQWIIARPDNAANIASALLESLNNPMISDENALKLAALKQSGAGNGE